MEKLMYWESEYSKYSSKDLTWLDKNTLPINYINSQIYAFMDH
jgi:hypothetical protein